jgi:CHASE2 domain-containing sensor protein
MAIKIAIRDVLVRSILVMLAFLALFVVFPSTYRSVDRWVDDMTAQLRPAKSLGDVVVIDITASDLEKHFGRVHNPLNPEILHTIISKIASATPTVIGVDIDTSHETFARFPKIDGNPQVVWAREAAADPEHPGEWILGKVLGGGYEGVRAASGLAFLIDDLDDGKTRSYQSAFEIGGHQVPSFPSQLAKTYRASKPGPYREYDPEMPRAIDFREPRDRVTLPVSLLLADTPDGVPWRRFVEGRIVLLGGSYDYADRHKTPLGEMTGVQIVASTLETELNGGGRPRIATFWIVIYSAIVYASAGLAIEIISKTMTLSRRVFYVMLLLGIPAAIFAALIAVGLKEVVPTLAVTYLIMVLIQLFGERVLEPLSKRVFRRWILIPEADRGAGGAPSATSSSGADETSAREK